MAHTGLGSRFSPSLTGTVTPYSNKPTQKGLYQHREAIASFIRLPIVVYSVQGAPE